MKLKNHINWIKNKSNICLTKARQRERRRSERLTATREPLEIPCPSRHRQQLKLQLLTQNTTVVVQSMVSQTPTSTSPKNMMMLLETQKRTKIANGGFGWVSHGRCKEREGGRWVCKPTKKIVEYLIGSSIYKLFLFLFYSIYNNLCFLFLKNLFGFWWCSSVIQCQDSPSCNESCENRQVESLKSKSWLK